MNTSAREAADQLVRLTRLVVRAEVLPDDGRWDGRAGAGPEDGGGDRILRHNQVTLTALEQQVMGLIVQGRYNGRLAGLLDIPPRVVEDHLAALLRDFGGRPGAAAVPAPEPRRGGRRGTLTLLLAPITASILVGGAAAAFALQAPQDAPRAARRAPATDALSPLAAYGASVQGGLQLRLPADVEASEDRLPRGLSTATSFWDRSTSRGAPMSYATIASPYWPLGTRVRITYGGRSTEGIVQDFGPAEWAVAQHRVPAIIDLSEKMMADLTGSARNTVLVRFQVVRWGRGEVYRVSGTGYRLAFGRD
ncbi:hypothetical protein [Actinomadura parmotrematis]|uniref:Uncharacterized protein n=1 Tax=Actinomadura parmotrematis TaxID=2864039 RepID=A0ABS7G656_9ACTN|nr:hypothetical protein [Actinomadura parmotrematis]MBW8487118.1 hypothetical protein [Actinomadura parmotrematis]